MTSLNRREFFERSKTAGLSLAAGGMILANPVRANPAEGALAVKKRLRDVGYVWEGQPAYRDFPPSMYGLGEGCAYFGLRKAYYLYHGNNAAALTKLAHLEEVLCDISIWRYRKVEDARGAIGWGIYHEKSPEVMRAEAETVSRLSLSFPNVRGAMLDDLLGAIKSQGYGPDTCAGIRTALQAHNPRLQVSTRRSASIRKPGFARDWWTRSSRPFPAGHAGSMSPTGPRWPKARRSKSGPAGITSTTRPRLRN